MSTPERQGGTANQKSQDGQPGVATASRAEDNWLLEITSQKLRMWSIVAAVVVFALHVFMGVVVDFGNTGASVTFIDQLAFPLVGLVIAAAILLLTRARVRVSARGVEVRNMLTPRFYPWSKVYGLSFPKRSRWARLELPDFEFVPMLAVQSADGERVVEAVRRFRELEDKYMPED